MKERPKNEKVRIVGGSHGCRALALPRPSADCIPTIVQTNRGSPANDMQGAFFGALGWPNDAGRFFAHCRKPAEMNSPLSNILDAGYCPLCGQPNDCQLCTVAVYKGPCWCATVKIPEELIARIPFELQNRACICPACVMKFHRNKEGSVPQPKILPGDFYFEGGLMVFTADFHLRRGYCCDHGCRHCPYQSMSTTNL